MIQLNVRLFTRVSVLVKKIKNILFLTLYDKTVGYKGGMMDNIK